MFAFVQKELHYVLHFFVPSTPLPEVMRGVLIVGVLYIVIEKDHLEKVVSQNL